jgi:hypothetical protein
MRATFIFATLCVAKCLATDMNLKAAHSKSTSHAPQKHHRKSKRAKSNDYVNQFQELAQVQDALDNIRDQVDRIDQAKIEAENENDNEIETENEIQIENAVDVEAETEFNPFAAVAAIFGNGNNDGRRNQNNNYRFTETNYREVQNDIVPDVWRLMEPRSEHRFAKFLEHQQNPEVPVAHIAGQSLRKARVRGRRLEPARNTDNVFKYMQKASETNYNNIYNRQSNHADKDAADNFETIVGEIENSEVIFFQIFYENDVINMFHQFCTCFINFESLI